MTAMTKLACRLAVLIDIFVAFSLLLGKCRYHIYIESLPYSSSFSISLLLVQPSKFVQSLNEMEMGHYFVLGSIR